MQFGCPFCCERFATVDLLKEHANRLHSELVANPMNDDGYDFNDYCREEGIYNTVKGMVTNEEIVSKGWDERRAFVAELVGDIPRRDLMILRIMTNLWPCRHFHEMSAEDCCPNRAAHHEYMMLIAAECGSDTDD